MNFQQLRSVREAVRRNFNLTEVANVLFTSQPGVSRQIRELEDELGVDLFLRNGKRLVGLTNAGQGVLPIIERLLLEADNLKRAGSDFARESDSTLVVVTTHTQARYVLPKIVQGFRASFPLVRIAMQQSAPEHISEWLLTGRADIGIATEGLGVTDDLITFPCYKWQHVIVVPNGHPLVALKNMTIEQLARYPLITYDVGFTGRKNIDEAFERAGIRPNIVLTAIDSDVIQQYVGLGLGVGIVASMAVEEACADNLCILRTDGLFAVNTTLLAVRRGSYIRTCAREFIARFAPQLSNFDIEQALQAA